MANERHKSGPGALTALLMIVVGSIWIGAARGGDVTAQAVLLGVATAASLLVLVLRPAWRPVFALGVAMYALVLGLFIHLAIHASWDKPFVDDPCPPFSFSFTRYDDLIANGILTLPFLGVAAFGCFPVARLFVRQASWLAPVVRLGSIGMLGGTIASLAWAIPNVLQKPPVEQYVESLPLLAMVPPVNGTPLRTIEQRQRLCEPPFCEPSLRASDPSLMPMIHKLEVYESRVTSDVVARRYCSQSARCTVVLRSADSDPEAEAPRLKGSASVLNCDKSFVVSVDRAESLAIREDTHLGLLFVEVTPRRAVDPQTLQVQAISIRDILDTTCPPAGWVIAAIAGAFVALILEIFRFRTRSRLRRIAAAPSGILGDDGWLVMKDLSSPIRVEKDAEIPPGPVIVMPIDSPPGAGSPYRGTVLSDKLEFLPGERKDVLRRERWMLQSPLDAVAIAMLLLAALPLATLWLR